MSEHPYVRAVAGHTAVHYGNEAGVECGAEPPFRYSHRREDITCRTCRGWLPIVAPKLQRPAPTMTNVQKMFVLLSEIRQCINDDQLMVAQRKVMAIEAILKSTGSPTGSPEAPTRPDEPRPT